MGVVRTLLRMKVLTIAFLAGYIAHSYIASDVRYNVQRSFGTPYLCDKKSKKRLEIFEQDFQVGSLEYRMQGLAKEPKFPRLLKKYSEGDSK